jgi:hypothetical protein
MLKVKFSSDTEIAQVISSAAQPNIHPTSSQATLFSSEASPSLRPPLPEWRASDLSCFFLRSTMQFDILLLWFDSLPPSSCLIIAINPVVWRLCAILWFDYCDLSCGLNIVRYPVVGILRSILWFEDCALSCSLIIAIYHTVWRLCAILWLDYCDLSCGLKIVRDPVVGLLRSIRRSEDSALSYGWKIAICLWYQESDIWNVRNIYNWMIFCLTCRIQLILIPLSLQPNNSLHAAR